MVVQQIAVAVVAAVAPFAWPVRCRSKSLPLDLSELTEGWVVILAQARVAALEVLCSFQRPR